MQQFGNVIALLETLGLRGTLPQTGGRFDPDILLYLNSNCLQQSAI